MTHAALRFACPSCGAKFRAIEAAGVATLVAHRTCQRCHERWRLIVTPLRVGEGARMDRATLIFAPKGGAR